jgi:hypothetical protein
VTLLGFGRRGCRNRRRRKQPSYEGQRAQSALGHCESRTRSQDESKRSQGWPKSRAPRVSFSLAQASLDAFDLGWSKATHVARLMQEAQALLQKFCIRFGSVRFAIG